MTLPFLRCQAAITLYISKPIKPWSSVSDYSFALNRRRTLFRNQTAITLHSETKYNHNEVIWVIKFCNHHKTHLQSVSVHWCFKDTPWNLTKYKNKYHYKFLKGFKWYYLQCCSHNFTSTCDFSFFKPYSKHW